MEEKYICYHELILEGVKTADYWFKGDYYDLKETTSSRDMAIDYAIKKSHGQSNNFIIDITGNPLKIETVIQQIEKVYQSSRRNWVNIIILKGDNNLLGVFQRKKN